jgi:hemolysin III
MRGNKPELVNSISHAAGAALAVVGSTVLVTLASVAGDLLRIVAFSIYGATLVFLYSASAVYHGLSGTAKRVAQRLDHMAIFLLIAGTYTPLALVALHGAWRSTILASVWGLALVGVGFEALLKERARIVSNVLYLAMGWLAVVAARPFIHALPAAALVWILAGGVLYSAGFVVYATKRFKRHHEVWHFMVLGASACHFVALARFVL